MRGVRPQTADFRDSAHPNTYIYMQIYSEIIGNLHDQQWTERSKTDRVEYIELDQWTAQKSRFVVRSEAGDEYAVALKRRTQLADGDILAYDPLNRRIVAFRIQLNDVLVADLSALAGAPTDELIHTAVELGHAIGNQHWPAVVKGTKVYVPLTVDRKVMASVMQTHRLEGVACSFQPGAEVIPYLAPHEIRRIFGGTDPECADRHHHHHEPVAEAL